MESAINSICFLNNDVGIAVGDNALYQVTLNSALSWTDEYEHPGKDDDVDKFVDVDFSGEFYGAAAAVLVDGSGALYYSENGQRHGAQLQAGKAIPQLYAMHQTRSSTWLPRKDAYTHLKAQANGHSAATLARR